LNTRIEDERRDGLELSRDTLSTNDRVAAWGSEVKCKVDNIGETGERIDLLGCIGSGK